MTFVCRMRPSILTIAIRNTIAVAGIAKKRTTTIMNIVVAVNMAVVASRAMCMR